MATTDVAQTQPPAATEGESAKKRGLFDPEAGFYKWFSHPVVLLLVTAVVTRWIFPDLSLVWQKSQKDLDVKSTLVTAISEDTAAMIGAIQVYELLGPERSAKLVDLNRAYLDWLSQSEGIAGKLSAYFADAQVAATWRTYADRVTDFLGTVDCGSPQRPARLQRIQQYLVSRGLPAIQKAVLLRCEKAPISRGTPYESAWYTMREEIIQAEDGVTTMVTSSHTAFASGAPRSACM